MTPAVPFPDLLGASRLHRKEHGCGAYPYENGSLLSVLAAGVAPSRIIEVGTAVGYTAVCMAVAAPRAQVDTIDFDPQHAELARANCARYGVNRRVTVHCGDAHDALPTFETGTYDFAFFDGFSPTAPIVNELHRLLRPGGMFACANLTLGGDGAQVLGNARMWLSHSLGETALAVRVSA